MSNAVYPVLPGLTFPIVKRKIFSTIVQKSISGREVRVANYAAPLYVWELPYEFLHDNNPHGNGDSFAFALQVLSAFQAARYGQFDSFLFLDPDDNSATDEQLGVGDGSNKLFQVGHNLGGGVVEPLTDISGLSVKLNGTPTAAYTVSATGLITFTTAPGNGVVVTASFSFWYRVVFDEDQLEWSKFSSHLHEVKKVTLRQVRS